jgi:hypothetical protein
MLLCASDYNQLPRSSSFRANCRECRSTSSMTSVIFILSRSRFISLPSSARNVSPILTSHSTKDSPLTPTPQPIPTNLRKVYVLNLTAKLAGSLLSRGSILDSIFMPSMREFGGMSERKSRAGLARIEKGLKVTRTSVRKRVIMVECGYGFCGRVVDWGGAVKYQ